MPRLLLAYSTVDGHTRTICERIRQSLERAGHAATLLEIVEPARVDAGACDGIVIGASIRYGKHRPALYGFIEANRETLDAKPCAFFSVNVVARKRGKDTAETNPYLRAFRRKTTWRPAEIAVFAGRLDYPSYGFWDRQIIRFIMWLTDGPTDPGTRVEFTDWRAVEAFAARVASRAAQERTMAGQPAPR
jgi:menaquinone-dependent protoporphyrinogen oxidase